MDDKDLELNEEFDLDSILSEFGDHSGEEPETASEEEDASSLLKDEAASEEASPEETEASEEEPSEETSEEETAEASSEEEEEASGEEEEAPSEEEQPDGEEPEVSADETILHEMHSEEDQEAQPVQPPLVYDPRAKLRELKRKLVAGPEKRYYTLSELGTGKLQIAVLINAALVLLCALGAVLFAGDRVPDSRMRLLIFTQVLSMLISGLLGLNLILDGFSELFKGRFTINTMVGLTFLACIADAAFSLRDLRVPCCCAFCLEMTFGLWARLQQRNTEMGQMDTLRKAVRLHSIVKVPDYYQGKPAFLRGEAQLEDFWAHYQDSTGPQKLQSFYAFISFLICIAISVLAGILHGLSMAIQILATSMLVAVPASFFVALTRPAAILERRLHMVGAVFCGWTGVRGLLGKAIFPLQDSDLFPKGSTKLSGIKFYSDRDPDMIVSYTASLILEAGGGLVPIFEQLMNSRGVITNPVHNFTRYDNGGIGGEVCGETILMGSTGFLESMGVEIPEGSMVNQAVYAAIDGQLSAVVAISYAKMRSAAAGMVTLCGYRQLTPVFTGSDFILTENFIRSKFEVKTSRLRFPSVEERAALSAAAVPEGLPSLAISTRPDLISYAYTVTGARALRSSCRAGMILHLLGGIVGLLIMAALAVTGSTELLTPINILLYQLVWMVPGLLITEWARHV